MTANKQYINKWNSNVCLPDSHLFNDAYVRLLKELERGANYDPNADNRHENERTANKPIP